MIGRFGLARRKRGLTVLPDIHKRILHVLLLSATGIGGNSVEQYTHSKGLANLTHPFAGDRTLPTVGCSDSSLEPRLLLVSKVRISEDVFDGSLSAREEATDSSRAGGRANDLHES